MILAPYRIFLYFFNTVTITIISYPMALYLLWEGLSFFFFKNAVGAPFYLTSSDDNILICSMDISWISVNLNFFFVLLNSVSGENGYVYHYAPIFIEKEWTLNSKSRSSDELTVSILYNHSWRCFVNFFHARPSVRSC